MADAATNDTPLWDDESDDGRRYSPGELRFLRVELAYEMLTLANHNIKRKTSDDTQHAAAQSLAWTERFYAAVRPGMPRRRGTPGPQHRNGRTQT